MGYAVASVLPRAPMIRHLHVLTIPALAVAAAAQGLSGGPLAGAAVAVGVDGGIAGQPDARTLVHRSGFGGTPALFPAVAHAPDLQTILAQYGAPGLDIDDTSSGRDDIMVDSSGTTVAPPNGWGVFSFSFRNGAVGQAGSRLAAEPAAERGAAVFSWVLPGSLLPPAVVDRVERSHSRTELGLSSAGNRDVDQLDVPLVLGRDQQGLLAIEPGFGPLLPQPAAIYFTVANGSLALVPAAWWGGATGSVPSGATIFRTLQSSSSSPWTVPHVWKTFAELGLQPAEDIDALAIDAANELVIFSTVGGARDQLLFVDLGTDGAQPVPVKKPNLQPVSDAVGSAGNDDIDAVCTLDPAVRSGVMIPDDFGFSCGSPRPAFQPNTYPVGGSASAFRRFANGQTSYDTWVLGWPPQSGRGPGWAVLVITLGDTTAPAITASFQVRDPNAAIAGDPRAYSLSVPPAFALSGLPLTFRWWIADSSFVDLAQAYPVKVFL